MNLLLDTNALLRWLDAPEQLTPVARSEIADPLNDVYVSAVVAWEMTIKVALRKLALPPDVQSWLPLRLREDRFLPLAVSFEHAFGVEQLPPHHRDPFDRLLIAQALAEDLTIVSRDRVFQIYPVGVLPC